MFDVITIGDATIDTFLVLEDDAATCSINKDTKHLCLHYGDKIPIIDTAQSVGGNAANVATGIAKMGGHTAIIAELGDDINGHTIKHELELHGVDTKYVTLLKNRDTRYSVVLNYKTERTVLSAHVKRTYRLPRMPKTKWVYYTSLGASFEGVQTKLIAHLKKHPETKLAMNPGSYQCKKGTKELKKVLPHLDILFVNKEEAAVLSGTKRSIKSMMSALHKAGVKTVIITDGEAGAYGSDGIEMLHMSIYPQTPVAKTGAGDAFASGFMGAQLQNKDLAESMQWGAANACGVVQQFGAQKGLQTARGVRSIIKAFPTVAPKPFR